MTHYFLSNPMISLQQCAIEIRRTGRRHSCCTDIGLFVGIGLISINVGLISINISLISINIGLISINIGLFVSISLIADTELLQTISVSDHIHVNCIIFSLPVYPCLPPWLFPQCMHASFRNCNRKLQTSKAPLKNQAQGTSLFTSAASNQRGFPKNSPWEAQVRLKFGASNQRGFPKSSPWKAQVRLLEGERRQIRRYKAGVV